MDTYGVTVNISGIPDADYDDICERIENFIREQAASIDVDFGVGHED